jgi:hypothetical protein
MFNQLRILDRKRRRTFLAALAAFTAAITGCDRKPQWRGVGTDAGNARPAPNPDASPGSNNHGDAS